MADLEVVELYPSPWSERLRWVLDAKGLSYARRPYVPLADEEAHRQRTGISTAPVLLADGEIVGDSDAAADWLERRHPTPALLPDDPRLRAQVRAWELAATEGLAPAGRLVFIGRAKALGIQPLADHFAAKYGWSEAAERRADRLLRTVVVDLARALDGASYLVGDRFTRADVTVASMVAGVLGHPADDLFLLDPVMRTMFGIPLGDDPAVAPLRQWRDELYRRHRGRLVRPPADAA